MMLLIFEASTPRGGYYRLGLAWMFPPRLVSIVTALTRCF